ncbi:MAG: hypothetical protein EAX86_12875 [Candidatus Heimdallarchaeota archaeon]|nr:hypothetical protein [Candidatus Heimdallarchaeota archaeon]
MSFVKFIVEFSIIGQSSVGRATFQRKFAPKTVSLLRFQLRKPIQSRIVVRDGEVAIPFKIGRAGPENSIQDVKRGQIVYWTQSQVLIIILNDKTMEYPVNLVGHADELGFFDQLRIGKSIKLEKVEPAIDEEDYL